MLLWRLGTMMGSMLLRTQLLCFRNPKQPFASLLHPGRPLWSHFGTPSPQLIHRNLLFTNAISAWWRKSKPGQYGEDPGQYKPGGYHLVSIGDRFDNGRYEVLQHLGHGLYSTVWKAKDKRR